MKVFQIGFNRCGTRSIHRYLHANGVRSIHWDEGRLAKRMFTNLASGDDLLAGYEDFDAFTDMEFLDHCGVHLEGYKLFPYLAARYPDAVFILNTRDRESWIRSRLRHGLGKNKVPYASKFMSTYNLSSIDRLTELWRADWDLHHRRVTEFFASKSHRFFVCRIETDFPHLLNYKIPEGKLVARHFTPPTKTQHESYQATVTRIMNYSLQSSLVATVPWPQSLRKYLTHKVNLTMSWILNVR